MKSIVIIIVGTFLLLQWLRREQICVLAQVFFIFSGIVAAVGSKLADDGAFTGFGYLVFGIIYFTSLGLFLITSRKEGSPDN